MVLRRRHKQKHWHGWPRARARRTDALHRQLAWRPTVARTDLTPESGDRPAVCPVAHSQGSGTDNSQVRDSCSVNGVTCEWSHWAIFPAPILRILSIGWWTILIFSTGCYLSRKTDMTSKERRLETQLTSPFRKWPQKQSVGPNSNTPNFKTKK